MAKYSRCFSNGDAAYRAESSAPQVISSDQLEARYREIQELRERVREAEERRRQAGDQRPPLELILQFQHVVTRRGRGAGRDDAKEPF
jgi:hypothetical protein